MKTPALIFPQTALRRSSLAAFFPLFEPLIVLRPASLAPPDPDAVLPDAGVVQYLSPAQKPDPAQERRIAELVDQWGQWRDMARGSGRLEAMKAGLELPPEDPENLDAIRKEIREYGRQSQVAEDLPPESRADLLLHLAHLQDREAAEIQELLDHAQQGGKNLGRLMGLEEDDAEPADYQDLAALKLPPLSHSLDGEHPMGPRLEAWANLAGRLELPAAWLATSNAPAAQLLMERADQRLTSKEGQRSPAGASRIAWPPDAPGPDSPMAQEAARLRLPDLRRLNDEALLDLRGRLDGEGFLAQARQGLANLLEFLAVEPWSQETAAEASHRAEALAQAWSNHLDGLLASRGEDRSLSLVVFPGLSQAQVRQLMVAPDPVGLPPAKDWPHGWPAGSCPMAVAW